MANPRRSPIREALAKSNGPLKIEVAAIANKDGVPKLIGFAGFSRIAKGGRWLEGGSGDDSRVERAEVALLTAKERLDQLPGGQDERVRARPACDLQ